MSLWSSLGLSEDASSSFGNFLKNASSAIESRIDGVLGTEQGSTAAGTSGQKKESPTNPTHTEDGAPTTDIAASAAATFSAFTKTTDDFFSSMLSTFGSGQEQGASSTKQHTVEMPESSPSQAVPPMRVPAPEASKKSPADEKETSPHHEDSNRPLDFREKTPQKENMWDVEVVEPEPEPVSAAPTVSSARKSFDRAPSFDERPVGRRTSAESKRSAGGVPERRSTDSRQPSRTSLDSRGGAPSPVQSVRDSFDEKPGRESFDSKPARSSFDAKPRDSLDSKPARDSIDCRVPPPPSPAIEPSPAESNEQPIPTINTDDSFSEPGADHASTLAPEPSPAASRVSTDSRRSMDARPPPAPSHSPVARTPDKATPVAESADLANLTRVVGERERQLMSAMEENRHLNETVEQLRLQIAALERKTVGGGDAELKRLLEEREEEVAAKEQIINELLAEGEKLSKAELKSAQTIKDLKKEKKDAEKSTQDLQKKFDAALAEVGDLKAQVGTMQELEKKLQDATRTLNELNDSQNKQIVKLEQDTTQLKTEKDNLQMALERAWAELSETRRLAAAQNSQAQSEALEKEINANQTLHAQLEQLRREKEKGDAEARKEVADLRAALARSEEEAGWKEDNLRKEITLIQSRLRAAEARNEDLSSSVQDSTRPLLRQIEALQTQNQAAQKNWEQAEKTLSSRLLEAETEREKAAIREKGWSDRVSELSTRIATVESQLSIERQEKARLAAELEVERGRSASYEGAQNELAAKLEIQKAAHARNLEDAKDGYQRMLRERLQEEREQWEQKRKEEERLRQPEPKREPEKGKLRLDTRASTPGRDGSVDKFAASQPSASSPISLDLQTNGTNPGHVIDRLHGMVKHLESQVGSMQSQLQMAIRTRDELADELVKVTGENETLKQSLGRVEQLENELADLNTRYTASLDLLGEKTEEVDELRQDLLDVKTLYKDQIMELSEQLAKLQSGAVAAAQ